MPPFLEMLNRNLLFSLLPMLDRSDAAISRTVLVSMKCCGKMPHFPLGLVPDQHQCPACGPVAGGCQRN